MNRKTNGTTMPAMPTKLPPMTPEATGGRNWACLYADLDNNHLCVGFGGHDREGTMINILNTLAQIDTTKLDKGTGASAHNATELPEDQLKQAKHETVAHMNPGNNESDSSDTLLSPADLPRGTTARHQNRLNSDQLPNIISSSTKVLEQGFVSGFVMKGSQQKLEAIKEKLDKLPARQPAPPARREPPAGTRPAGPFRQTIEMELSIPKDAAGILHSVTSLLWGERVNIISLNSESFEDKDERPTDAYIRARLQLRVGDNLSAFRERMTAKLAEENEKWEPHFELYTDDGTGRRRA